LPHHERCSVSLIYHAGFGAPKVFEISVRDS
jgi:hypothetical protein